MSAPRYPETMLIRLIRATTSRQDLVALQTLFIELEEAGDIVITRRMCFEVAQREGFLTKNNNFNN